MTPLDLADARFDRAVGALRESDPTARVVLDRDTGLVRSLDGTFAVDIPVATASLPRSDQASAAAVIFLDRFGGAFGIPGWHAIRPEAAVPIARSLWFTFRIDRSASGEENLVARVCANGATVRSVRIVTASEFDADAQTADSPVNEPFETTERVPTL